MGKVPSFVIAKLLRFLTRLRGGGSAFPGLVLMKFRPQVLRETLGSLRLGTVFVSGSNGKSTTTTMIAALLRAHGVAVFSNRAGGNLPQGLASAVVGDAGLGGRVSADIAVLEVDEAYAGMIADALAPDWVVLTNIQVDQLNRFGEPENVYRMLRDLAARATTGVLVNAGDPNLVALGAEIAARGSRVEFVDLSPDALASARHGVVAAPLHSEAPESLQGSAVAVLSTTSGARATVQVGGEDIALDLPAPGLHYAVDATLAVGCASLVGGRDLDPQTVARSMGQSVPVFGRGETISFKGADISLTMMKNLPSLQANLDAMTEAPELVWVAVDEGTPDPSWIYDVELGVVDHVDVLTGTKAWQWALFLEYRGIPCGRVIEDTSQALAAVRRLALEKGVAVTAIVNYEQMMLIRRLAGYKELEGVR
ncbi:MAG: Mur ligase family protein [Actinobacteria bacterium]|nr:Mur ligase family protein [Actinomycetota bacterium]